MDRSIWESDGNTKCEGKFARRIKVGYVPLGKEESNVGEGSTQKGSPNRVDGWKAEGRWKVKLGFVVTGKVLNK